MSASTSVHNPGSAAHQRLKVLEALAANDLTQAEILAALLKLPYAKRPSMKQVWQRINELRLLQFITMLDSTRQDKNGRRHSLYEITQQGLDAIAVPILCEKTTTAA